MQEEERVSGISHFSGSGSRGWVQRMWQCLIFAQFRHIRWTKLLVIHLGAPDAIHVFKMGVRIM